MSPAKPNNLALVLSGGGARGAAHLGILKALQKNSLNPDIYIGTSLGAIIATMMAVYDDVNYVIDKYFAFTHRHNVLELVDNLFATSKIKSKGGLIDGAKVIEVIAEEAGLIGIKLSQTKKPLYITATDLNSGEEIIFGFPQEFKPRKRTGFKNYYRPVFYPKDILITEALRATIGLPVLFKPYPMRLKGKKLALLDGGIRDTCPFRLAAYIPDVKHIFASVLGYAGEQKVDFNQQDIPHLFFQFLDISTTLSQVGNAAQDALFTERNAPIVRIVNPGIFSLNPVAFKKSRAVMLSAYHTMKDIFSKFKNMQQFWKGWGSRQADYFSFPRWKLQKLGHHESNIFCLTDLRSPLEKELKKKGLKYRFKKYFA